MINIPLLILACVIYVGYKLAKKEIVIIDNSEDNWFKKQ